MKINPLITCKHQSNSKVFAKYKFLELGRVFWSSTTKYCFGVLALV